MNIIEKLRKATFRGIKNFDMIGKGNKVLIAVSGGKDSLAALDILVHLQKYSDLEFTLTACYVVPEIPGISNLTDELKKRFEDYGIDYIIQKLNIPEGSKLREGIDEASTCQRCSYSRRIALFKIAEEQGFDRIVYGHHMDDMVHTFLQNVYLKKELKIMLPVNKMRKGDFWIIRPFVYVREEEIIRFCNRREIIPIESNCPLKDITNRTQMKNVLKNLEVQLPDFAQKLMLSYIAKLPDEIGYVGK